MLTRRQMLALLGIGGAAFSTTTAAAQKPSKQPKLETVTLTISGMT